MPGARALLRLDARDRVLPAVAQRRGARRAPRSTPGAIVASSPSCSGGRSTSVSQDARRHLGAAVPARHQRADHARAAELDATAARRRAAAPATRRAPRARAASRGRRPPCRRAARRRARHRAPRAAHRARSRRAPAPRRHRAAHRSPVGRRAARAATAAAAARPSASSCDRARRAACPRCVAAAQRLHQLEVAARHLVERHRAAGTLDLRPREMRHAGRLQLLQVAQQRTRRPDGCVVAALDARARRARARRTGAPARRAPARSSNSHASRSVTSAPSSVAVRGSDVAAAWHEQLARREPRQHRFELARRDDREPQLAGGDVGGRDAAIASPASPRALSRSPRRSCCARRRAARRRMRRPARPSPPLRAARCPSRRLGSSTCSQIATR